MWHQKTPTNQLWSDLYILLAAKATAPKAERANKLLNCISDLIKKKGDKETKSKEGRERKKKKKGKKIQLGEL